MEKALNVLRELYLVINFNSYWKPRVDEAIIELEEAMKPKTCDGCKYWTPSWECESFLNNKRLQNDLDMHIRNLKAEGIGICNQRSLENITKEKHKNYGCVHYRPKDTQC